MRLAIGDDHRFANGFAAFFTISRVGYNGKANGIHAIIGVEVGHIRSSGRRITITEIPEEIHYITACIRVVPTVEVDEASVLIKVEVRLNITAHTAFGYVNLITEGFRTAYTLVINKGYG